MSGHIYYILSTKTTINTNNFKLCVFDSSSAKFAKLLDQTVKDDLNPFFSNLIELLIRHINRNSSGNGNRSIISRTNKTEHACTVCVIIVLNR